LSHFTPDDPAPISARERFHNYLMSTIGPFPVLAEAAGAGILQWNDSPHEWGQGAEGYGKRFGNNLAYNGVRQTITYGLSEALHEDNRYFASNRKGFGRVGYALVSPATAKRRSGRRSISISSLAGMAGAAGISRTWSPSSWQGWDQAARSFGFTYAGAAGLNLFREFVPDIIHRLRK
jgi:hypothetical protein